MKYLIIPAKHLALTHPHLSSHVCHIILCHLHHSSRVRRHSGVSLSILLWSRVRLHLWSVKTTWVRKKGWERRWERHNKFTVCQTDSSCFLPLMKREQKKSFHQCVSYTFFSSSHPCRNFPIFVSSFTLYFTSICENSSLDTQHTLVSYSCDVLFLVSFPSSRCDILDNQKRMKAVESTRGNLTPHRHISLAYVRRDACGLHPPFYPFNPFWFIIKSGSVRFSTHIQGTQ